MTRVDFEPYSLRHALSADGRLREGGWVAISQTIAREDHLRLGVSDQHNPLNTTAVFGGALLPAPAPFGGQVSIKAPLIPSLPGAPDVAIVRLEATIGPNGVTYYEQVAGRTLPYQPPGILLPDSCPRGAFPFAAQFNFVDGTHARARTTEPCPPKAARRRRAAGKGS